ncbi:hypothetical protein [Halobacteriovorax sp. ZH5_bin.2]|uniref:hypothetical protein n=1 Tax=unclassified Halobacteriovorax TaxID=2639665 RepID=UPI00372077E8
MKLLIVMLISTLSFAAPAAKSEGEVETKSFNTKEEVLDNPTLKTLSGSLKRWSFYSSFKYNAGALDNLNDAERPNIRNAGNTTSLTNFTGNFGVKYRLSKTDNLSLQVGIEKKAPFHGSVDSENPMVQYELDTYGDSLNIDNPVLSYFKTYYLFGIQNVTFLQYQYATWDYYKDLGINSVFNISHSLAYKVWKAAYIALSGNATQYFYDKSTISFNGMEIAGKDRQVNRSFSLSLAGELYFSRSLSLRLITDLYSADHFRSERINEKVLQQTIAMTYFFTRDISISPNMRFIAEDIRADRTNVGLTMNVNL